EKKHGLSLITSKQAFDVRKTKVLPKPFETGDRIVAPIVCPGRYPGECVAAAKGRSILVRKCTQTGKTGGRIPIKITRSKHNIFIGEAC
ncbi:hypothetical protein COY95_02510, partial [Candidatus Woesearchaeota archaeon CG_4_10_14_0_8_um_filter_47_5]